MKIRPFFVLGAETRRIHLAHLFDPVLAGPTSPAGPNKKLTLSLNNESLLKGGRYGC
ncbi:MAG: hypothetical protein JW953_08485 [Anaerolineae bacterium]|nr:hypothetical protein [Anaerolineae bacterium]